MLISIDDFGTPEADACSRLTDSRVFPYSFVADLTDCPDNVRAILIEVDKYDGYDDQYPHSIENWQELYTGVA